MICALIAKNLNLIVATKYHFSEAYVSVLEVSDIDPSVAERNFAEKIKDSFEISNKKCSKHSYSSKIPKVSNWICWYNSDVRIFRMV